jgi:hypothetical protein
MNKDFDPHIDFLENTIKDLKRVYFETHNNPKFKQELHSKIYDYERALFRYKNQFKKKLT